MSSSIFNEVGSKVDAPGAEADTFVTTESACAGVGPRLTADPLVEVDADVDAEDGSDDSRRFCAGRGAGSLMACGARGGMPSVSVAPVSPPSSLSPACSA
jgi:hypothetical protein